MSVLRIESASRTVSVTPAPRMMLLLASIEKGLTTTDCP